MDSADLVKDHDAGATIVVARTGHPERLQTSGMRRGPCRAVGARQLGLFAMLAVSREPLNQRAGCDDTTHTQKSVHGGSCPLGRTEITGLSSILRSRRHEGDKMTQQSETFRELSHETLREKRRAYLRENRRSLYQEFLKDGDLEEHLTSAANSTTRYAEDLIASGT